MTILKALICSISLLCRGSPKYRFWSDNFKKLRGPQCFYSVAFGLGGKISQFLFQYFGKLPGFNLWKLTRLSEVFPPAVCQPFFKRARECEGELLHVVYEVWLVSYLLLLVPNMVLWKMNNHKHRTKQTYESYTFQPLMSFRCVSMWAGTYPGYPRFFSPETAHKKSLAPQAAQPASKVSYLGELNESAPRSRVLARFASLAQIGELARRLQAAPMLYGSSLEFEFYKRLLHVWK